jgi:DNA-binding response OmpR family regulator
MKVLVVDDSLVVRTIIEKSVKPKGYEVLQAANGQEALGILAKPFSTDELTAKVQATLAKFRSEQDARRTPASSRE